MQVQERLRQFGPPRLQNTALTQFHFCTFLGRDLFGPFFLGSREADILGKDHFQSALDCQAILVKDVQRNGGRLDLQLSLKYRGEFLQRILKLICDRDKFQQRRPLLLFCDDGCVFSPIVAAALLCRLHPHLSGKKQCIIVYWHLQRFRIAPCFAPRYRCVVLILIAGISAFERLIVCIVDDAVRVVQRKCLRLYSKKYGDINQYPREDNEVREFYLNQRIVLDVNSTDVSEWIKVGNIVLQNVLTYVTQSCYGNLTSLASIFRT